MIDTRENYYALCIAIVKRTSLEISFDALKNGYKNHRAKKVYTKADILDMVELRKVMLPREIAKMYGLKS